MHEPSLRTSRLMIAGGFLAVIAIGAAGFLAGRATSPRPPVAPTVEKAAPPPVAAPAVLQPPRALARADIIALGNRAADAFASGQPLPPDLAGLAGRRFDLAIVFGCSGPSQPESEEPLRWRYDSPQQTLRVHAAPAKWDGADWKIPDSPDAQYRAEGFWITRAWSSAESCPAQAAPADADPAAKPEHTLAIARFTASALRQMASARPRSFSTVQRIAPDGLHPELGFRVRLTGRIDKLPDGQPIRCTQPGGGEQRPVCVIAASFDELRLESPGAAGTLAVWPMGARSQPD